MGAGGIGGSVAGAAPGGDAQEPEPLEGEDDSEAEQHGQVDAHDDRDEDPGLCPAANGPNREGRGRPGHEYREPHVHVLERQLSPDKGSHRGSQDQGNSSIPEHGRGQGDKSDREQLRK